MCAVSVTDLIDNSIRYLNLGLTATAYSSELSKSNQTSTAQNIDKVYVTMADVSQRGSAGEAQFENGPLVDNRGREFHETKGDASEVPVLLEGLCGK